MSPPSIGDIRRDDELLDALGARRRPQSEDQVADLLGEWVAQVDAAPAAKRGGRYARARRSSTRVGVAAAIVVGALSMSGMAAAVTGVSGISKVAQNIGLTGRSVHTAVADGPSGPGSSGHPTSTWQAPGPVQSTAGPADPSGAATASSTGADTKTSVTAPQTAQRVMPGFTSASTGVWEPSPIRTARGGPVVLPTAPGQTSTASPPVSSSASSSASPSSSSSGSSSSSSPSSRPSTTRSPRPSTTPPGTTPPGYAPSASPRSSSSSTSSAQTSSSSAASSTTSGTSTTGSGSATSGR